MSIPSLLGMTLHRPDATIRGAGDLCGTCPGDFLGGVFSGVACARCGWRTLRLGLASLCAPVALLAALLLLGGCASTTKEESLSSTADRLYKDAREDMQAGAYDRAIKALERVEGLAAGSTLSQQAVLDMAYVHWKSDDRVQALSTIDRFIKLNPSSPALDYAMYLKGLINFNDSLGLLGVLAGQDLSERDQRAARDSFQAFRLLVDQFPSSRYTADARVRMGQIVNSLAAYEVHVARYYFRRGAYVAAAARAQLAVAEFQRAPATEEALHIMVQSYAKLNLPELRDGAERVLKLNFPNSSFLGSTTASGKPWWRLW
jgi:outer membrane protein assembly factor BamD